MVNKIFFVVCLLSSLRCEQSVLVLDVHWCPVRMEGVGCQDVSPATTKLPNTLSDVSLLLLCEWHMPPAQLSIDRQ